MNAELLREEYSFLAEKFKGKSVMISGATGLIGSHAVKQIDSINEMYAAAIKPIVLYRDEEKKNKLESELMNPDLAEFVKCDVEEEIPYQGSVDYVVHCAGFSGGTKMHLKDPVKIFDTGLIGTRNLLDFSAAHSVRGFLYVSTYEVYGDSSTDERITEDFPCKLDTFVPRNSYAEIKRLCESLLCAFSAKYGFNTYAVRLTSTFGSGVRYNDSRFFAEFARCAVEGRDIVLKSHGETVRSYLDADDAAIAFLYVLANGQNCNAYNLTNMDNEISIKDIAENIIKLSGADIKLIFDVPEDAHKLGLRKEGRTVMDASRIYSVGWKPVWSLEDTLEKLIVSMKENKGQNL